MPRYLPSFSTVGQIPQVPADFASAVRLTKEQFLIEFPRLLSTFTSHGISQAITRIGRHIIQFHIRRIDAGQREDISFGYIIMPVGTDQERLLAFKLAALLRIMFNKFAMWNLTERSAMNGSYNRRSIQERLFSDIIGAMLAFQDILFSI